MDRETDENAGSHCCLVGIGRLQVTSTPNCNDLLGPNADVTDTLLLLYRCPDGQRDRRECGKSLLPCGYRSITSHQHAQL